MGKNIILHQDEFASDLHSNREIGRILAIFELTVRGARDISYKIFGNVAGENVLLPKDRVCLIICTNYDANGYAYRSLQELYSPLISRVHRGKEESVPTLQHTLVRALSEKITSEAWKKDPRSNSASEYYTKFFQYTAYSGLIDSTLAFISYPDQMGTEELDGLLDLYGGTDNLDIRPFLFGEDIPDPVLNYVVKSRSYILQSPIIVRSGILQSFLVITSRILKDNKYEVTSCLDSEYPLNWALQYYKACSGMLLEIHRHILSVDKLLVDTRTLCATSPVIESYVLMGESKNPSPPGRLSSMEIEDIKDGVKKIRRVDSSGAVNYYDAVSKFSDNELSEIEMALVRSARSTSNRLASMVNSSVYLAKDLLWMVKNDAETNVRWKGSRKEKEKHLAGCILALKGILSTPPLVRSLLSYGTFTAVNRRSRLPTIGALLRCVTSRDTPLLLDVSSLVNKDESRILDLDTELPKVHFEWLNWRADGDMRLYTLYLLTANPVYIKHTLKYAVGELENICSNPRIMNSLEAGFQVTPQGKMFISDKGKSLNSGFDLYSLSRGEGSEPSTLLDSIEVLVKQCLASGLEVDEEISSVKKSVETLLEIKNSLALKAVDFYILDVSCARLLNPASWDLLAGSK